MSSIKNEHRLAHKLILSVIAAFLVSAAFFLVLQNTARNMIRSYCARPEVIAAHLEKKADSLQHYIKDHNISISGILELDGWVAREDLTTVAVYYDDKLLYSSYMVFPNFSLKSKTPYESLSLNNSYTLTFCDGEALVFISDLFAHRYTDYATYLNLVIFFLCFIIIMILLISKKVAYINTLEQEIQVLEGGNLNYAITIKGNDELASLALEIDEMRRAFIAREQYADRMRAAGNELMTGISHDLRTPLTALIGYLEVMEGEEVPTKQSPFLQKCKNRAFQINGLINDLFEYFFVSTSGDEQLQLGTYAAREALNEIIRDYAFLMERSGFTVINHIELPPGSIKVDGDMIQRVFDNLLSNIRRYADPAHPVRLESVFQCHELLLIIHNRILDYPETVRHTGLGLKTCEKMMSLQGGRFIYGHQDGCYTVQLGFTLI